jgi:hypothetical protein
MKKKKKSNRHIHVSSNLRDFINARLEPGANRRADGEPFQRLPVEFKTVETVCRSFSWLHLAEARC